MNLTPNIFHTIGIVATAVGLTAAVRAAWALRFTLMSARTYLRTRLCGAPVSFRQIAAMHAEKIDPSAVIAAWAMLNLEGLNVSIEAIETHVMVGGDVRHVVSAMITASRLRTPLT